MHNPRCRASARKRTFDEWRRPFYMSRSILQERGSTSCSESMSGGQREKALFPYGMPLSSERGDVVVVFSGEEFPEPGTAQHLKAARTPV